jgi:hypothetical protein
MVFPYYRLSTGGMPQRVVARLIVYVEYTFRTAVRSSAYGPGVQFRGV